MTEQTGEVGFTGERKEEQLSEGAVNLDLGSLTRRVTGEPCAPCRNLGGTQPIEGRRCKTKKERVESIEATNLSAM